MNHKMLLKQWAARRQLIYRWHKEGRTMKSIATQLGIKWQRVQQIIAKEGGK